MAEAEVELDLRVENGGSAVHLVGSRGRYVAEFASLRALVHFVRLGWRYRRQVPPGWRIPIRWRGMQWG